MFIVSGYLGFEAVVDLVFMAYFHFIPQTFCVLRQSFRSARNVTPVVKCSCHDNLDSINFGKYSSQA